uniref:Esterase n=1 Tax=uncultured organism TaxID=155900 RepID=A0A141M5K3_9ZZZZ|nr:esterase [uncultured organism]
MSRPRTAVHDRVLELVQQQIAAGQQLGVQVCAYQNGEKIVDIVAGVMGPDDPRPVQPDTLFNSFSTTKGVAATALHILAEQGKLEYEQPVARYWPAFAANGKERVTVAQAMSHQAGLHAMPTPSTIETLCDWEGGLNWVASGVPAWEPGTATGYHAITYAWVVGGIVYGATGRHIKDVIREEIAIPLGVADELFVGIPEGVEDRLATLAVPAPGEGMALPIPPDHDFFKAMPPSLGGHVYNDMRVRRACLPSANGHFSARALAKMYAALAGGGVVDGVRLVSPERIALMQRILTADMDRVLMLPLRKGVGFMMGGPVNGVSGVFGPRETAFGHSGAGGSTAFCDPETGLAVAVTINQMQMTLQAEGPTYAICQLIREELGCA